MFDSIKRKVAASVLGSLLKSLATSKDTQTTITGILAAAVLAIPGLDLGKLIAGDPLQIAHAASALLVALIGYLATKPGKDGAATLTGVLAGALQMTAGSVEAVTTAVVLALLGFFTNKPVHPAKP